MQFAIGVCIGIVIGVWIGWLLFRVRWEDGD